MALPASQLGAASSIVGRLAGQIRFGLRKLIWLRAKLNKRSRGDQVALPVPLSLERAPWLRQGRLMTLLRAGVTLH